MPTAVSHASGSYAGSISFLAGDAPRTKERQWRSQVLHSTGQIPPTVTSETAEQGQVWLG